MNLHALVLPVSQLQLEVTRLLPWIHVWYETTQSVQMTTHVHWAVSSNTIHRSNTAVESTVIKRLGCS